MDNKEELLQLLDLPNYAAIQEMRMAFYEKYNFHKMLLDNAPNEVVKALQLKHIEKLNNLRYLVDENAQAATAEFSRASRVTNNEEQAPPAVPGNATSIMRHDEGTPAAGTHNTQFAAQFTIENGRYQGKQIFLREGFTNIGREEVIEIFNIILEDDPYISRYHAHVHIKGTTALICDEGKFNSGKSSLNGLQINNSKVAVRQHQLQDGDLLQFGKTTLRFNWCAAEQQAQPQYAQQAQAQDNRSVIIRF
jgi:pSer/pThr/pTyr-binding forkhead associated (FHA) protein